MALLREGDRRTLESVICGVTMGLQVIKESEVVGRRLERGAERVRKMSPEVSRVFCLGA